MTTGCHPLPVDPTPFAKTIAERQRDDIIIAATYNSLLNTRPHCYSLKVQNKALAFFVANAPMLADLLPSTIISISDLCRDHDKHLDDAHHTAWQTHVFAEKQLFQHIIRKMRATHLDLEIKPLRLRPQPSWHNQIFHEDALTAIQRLPDTSVDLIVTSPPYAEQRDYDGIPEWRYPRWTVDWMRGVRSKLKVGGSVVIVIRPHLRWGAESRYVRRTITAVTEDDWVQNGTLSWVKPDAPPLGRTDRPRPAWEPIYWFSQSPNPYCNPKAIGHYSERIGLRTNKGSGQHIHHKAPGKVGAGIARSPDVLIVPQRRSDVLTIALARNDRSPHNQHSAQFPEDLAERLIRMFCPLGGIVLDPFMGSGSTAIAATRAGRIFVGCETQADYVAYAIGRYRRFLREHRS